MTPNFDTFSSAPAIDDFVVRLVEEAEGGLHVEFASAARGRLAWFPAWEHVDRDLRHFIPSDIPIGTIDEPYDDRDEAWRIAIFESAGWIYVGEADGPYEEPARTFRVRGEHYLNAWNALIDQFNPMTPLEDPS